MVLFQNVAAKVTIEIAPDCMDVIGVILDVVVFDEESGALHAVIMGFTRFLGSGPGENDVLHASLLQLVPTGAGQMVGHIADVDIYQLVQPEALLRRHFREGNTHRVERRDFLIGASVDISGRLIGDDGFF